MNNTLRIAAITLGSLAVGHHEVSLFVPGDGPDAPPAAAVVVASSTASVVAPYAPVVVAVVDTITDAEYAAMLPIKCRSA